jgi:hypothetical protein
MPTLPTANPNRAFQETVSTPAPATQQPAQQQPAIQPQPPVVNPNANFQNNVTPLQSPTPSTSLNATPSLNLPQPTAPPVQQSYFGSVATDVQNTQASLQAAYDKQSASLQSQLDTLKTQQQTELDAEKQLSQPFNAQLEQTQEQQLHVNDNFEANQNLANELNSIVNQANTQLSNGSNRFASQATIQASQSSTISSLTARAGLIQAAMSAYSGQISAAYTQIDRSVAAINADNTDQLNYYNTLLTLNNQDQLSLTDQQKTNVQNQITTLQQQAQDAQTTADNIKQAMLNPSTAQAYAQAGVTLTDTPQQINQKLGDYAYSKELSDQNKSMATNGFTAVIPGQAAPAGAQLISLTDSKGKTQQYYSTSPKTQVVNLGNGSSRLINSDTGQVIASYGSGGGGGTPNVNIINADGQSLSVPINVAPYVQTSHSGVAYADLSSVQGTAAQKAEVVKEAQAAGIKVITNANTATDLFNIGDANNKLDTVTDLLSGIDQPGWVERAAYGFGLTSLATAAQSDPRKAAAGVLSSIGTDVLKAMQGVQGSRMSQAAVANINKELPTIYDTQATVSQKVSNLQALLSDRENAILGQPGSNAAAAAANATYELNGQTYAQGPDGLYYPQ